MYYTCAFHSKSILAATIETKEYPLLFKNMINLSLSDFNVLTSVDVMTLE